MASLTQDLSIRRQRAGAMIERAMGPDLLAAFADRRTIELMLNPDGKVWLERLGEPMKHIGHMTPEAALTVLTTVAGYHGKEVTETAPILECEFPLDGSRFAGQMPPVVAEATFALRKKAVAIFTLDEYVSAGQMTDQQRGILVDAVQAHKNILVVGGTSSGKTTLVNSIINQMVVSTKSERIVIIEDTGEIQCAAENVVQFHTSVEVSMTQLLRTTLRMRPDRILVGEVRGSEALDLLMAWNTGHPGGAATLHSDSARSGLDRLCMLVSMHRDAPRSIEPLIGEAVHVVVSIARTPEGRRVQEIVEVSGFANGAFITKSL